MTAPAPVLLILTRAGADCPGNQEPSPSLSSEGSWLSGGQWRIVR